MGTINLHSLCEKGTRSLGPGLRYGIWVQGCPFNCKGCTSPETRPFVMQNLLPIESVANSIIENKLIEGITISGGEPFMQASKLIEILKQVKVLRPEINTIIYTGFKRSEIDWKEAKDLLQMTDVLIDGKYIQELDDGIGLRGSSNQVVHFLTDRLVQFKDFFFGVRNLEVTIHSPYSRTIIGIPNKHIKNL